MLIDTEAEVFQNLMNKQIGILFETEDYEKSDGSTGIKPVPVAFFEASTQRTATEILDYKTQPAQIETLMHLLGHRPLRQSRQTASAQATTEVSDEDIPF